MYRKPCIESLAEKASQRKPRRESLAEKASQRKGIKKIVGREERRKVCRDHTGRQFEVLTDRRG